MTDALPYDEQFQDAFGPGIGDNQPPEDADPLRDRLTDTHGALIARHAALLAEEAARVPETIEDEETANDVSDYESDLIKCLKALEGARVAEKEPFLTAGRAVDGFFQKLAGNPKPPHSGLNKIKATANHALTIWGRKKRDAELRRRREEENKARAEAEKARQKAEEADKAAMEAQETTDREMDSAIEAEDRAAQAEADHVTAQRAAEASAAEMSRSRSDKGAGFGLVTFWDYRALNRRIIDLEKLRQHLPEDAIISAVKSYIKAGGRQLTGVEIFENTTNRTRGGR